MNEKFFYFALLGAALIVGFSFGRVLAKVARSKLWQRQILSLVGAILVLVGIVCADEDRRFRILAIIGIFLQVSGVAASFTREKKA